MTTNNIETCSFTLAVKKKVSAEGQPDADFVNCRAFKNIAVLLDKYVSKGDNIAVTGRIASRTYENAEHNKIYLTEVIVENLTFLERKKEGVENNENKLPEFGKEVVITADDLPF